MESRRRAIHEVPSQRPARAATIDVETGRIGLIDRTGSGTGRRRQQSWEHHVARTWTISLDVDKVAHAIARVAHSKSQVIMQGRVPSPRAEHCRAGLDQGQCKVSEVQRSGSSSFLTLLRIPA